MNKGYDGIKIHPREYQRDALRAIWKALYGKDGIFTKALAVLGTGCGKTIIFSMLINQLVKNDNRKVLILAHRDELLRQTQDKLEASTGIQSAIEKASETGVGTFHNVVIASVQTLCRPKRYSQYDSNHFDLVIVDEAHHTIAKSYMSVLDYFSSAKVLGVTATPSRGDKQSLGKFFECIPYEYTLHQAIEDGWLSPIRARTCPVDIDITECKMSAGDYQLGDLGTLIAPYLEAIADQIVEHAGCRKTLLFLPLVATSKTMAQILCAKGIECRSVDGKMGKEERKETLEWYRNAPPGSALCNAMLATEGFDQADIDCVVVLRPTKSTGLYSQCVGRGTRVLSEAINAPDLDAEQRKVIIAASDKPNLLLLDFLWHSAQHKLCTAASLSAHSDDIKERVDAIQKKGGEMLLSDMEDEAHNEVRIERESQLAMIIEASKGKQALEIDPVVQALSIFNEDILEYEPEMAWESDKISDGQMAYLKKNKFDCADWSKGFASTVIDSLSSRIDKGLCSPNQMRLLQKQGIPNAHLVTFEDAGVMIDKLSKTWEKSKRWRGKR